jgi:hypothetical protein
MNPARSRILEAMLAILEAVLSTGDVERESLLSRVNAAALGKSNCPIATFLASRPV